MTATPGKKAKSTRGRSEEKSRRPAPAKVPRESQAARKERAERVLGLLYKNYPNAVCALNHRNAFELLIATILSAQCTDARVNMVTPELFARYPTPEKMAGATQEQIEQLIKTTGFFRNKAKSILGASRLIGDKFHGQVPQTMDELLELPGVARKTANVVLGTAFKQNIGVVVDTHVGRLSHRLGFTKQTETEIWLRFVDLLESVCLWFMMKRGLRVAPLKKPILVRKRGLENP